VTLVLCALSDGINKTHTHSLVTHTAAAAAAKSKKQRSGRKDGPSRAHDSTKNSLSLTHSFPPQRTFYTTIINNIISCRHAYIKAGAQSQINALSDDHRLNVYTPGAHVARPPAASRSGITIRTHPLISAFKSQSLPLSLVSLALPLPNINFLNREQIISGGECIFGPR
jgi:hypothetical protein